MIVLNTNINLLSQNRLKIRMGPSGVHLFDRRSGLNILLDEVHCTRFLWARAPRHVSIALTNACDLSCEYCYAPKVRAALDFNRLKEWLSELDDNGCLGVGFGGGEPTLYRHLPELCEYVCHRTKLAVTLTTHGHHLDDEYIELLKDKVHFIRVSMDGVGATYEALRGRSFSILLHRLHRLSKLIPFGVNYVVNASTFPDLDKAIILAKQIGAAEFLLLPEQSVNKHGGIDADTKTKLESWVKRYAGEVPLSVSERGADGLPVCNPHYAEKGLQAYAHIDATGTLKSSSYDDEGVSVGSSSLMQTLTQLHNLEHKDTI